MCRACPRALFRDKTAFRRQTRCAASCNRAGQAALGMIQAATGQHDFRRFRIGQLQALDADLRHRFLGGIGFRRRVLRLVVALLIGGGNLEQGAQGHDGDVSPVTSSGPESLETPDYHDTFPAAAFFCLIVSGYFFYL